MELAGHSRMETTQRYLDLDDRIRDERFERVTEAQWRAAGEAAGADGEAPPAEGREGPEAPPGEGPPPGDGPRTRPSEATGDAGDRGAPSAAEEDARPPAGTPTLLDWS
jgi:hypothetical protein